MSPTYLQATLARAPAHLLAPAAMRGHLSGVGVQPSVEATSGDLDRFLAEVERRAVRIAEISTRDRDEALDIVQDVMLKFAHKYGRRDPNEWRPLFYRILRNQVIDWQRRGKVRNRFRVWLGGDGESAEDPIEQLPDGGSTDPLHGVGLERATKELDHALGDLPGRQREAFLLRLWEGLSVAETASAMGCSEGSVKTHLSRAVHSLRRSLEGHWGAHWDG